MSWGDKMVKRIWIVGVVLFGLSSFYFVRIATCNSSRASEHRWADASKDVVGTAYGYSSSKVWFTVGKGIVNEVYYPSIDSAQVGDSQLLFLTADKKVLEEKKDFTFRVSHPPQIPRAIIEAKNQLYKISFIKDVLTDPQRQALRIRYQFQSLSPLIKVYVLHKPTVDNDGAFDKGLVLPELLRDVKVTQYPELLRDAKVTQYKDNRRGVGFLAWDMEKQQSSYQAVLSSVSFTKSSVGIVGTTDGWQDLHQNQEMVLQIPENGPGNIAFTAELEQLPSQLEIAIGFGMSQDEATKNAFESLRTPFNEIQKNYDTDWRNYLATLHVPWVKELPIELQNDVLWSAALLKTHEDKTNPGAIIASLSIPHLPQGYGHPDGKNTGGYHLVWVRDLFKAAVAFLRLGDLRTAYNALRFMLRMEDKNNKKLAQNTWVDGTPFWHGLQMDQEAFPLILASLLKSRGVPLEVDLEDFLQRRIQKLYDSQGFTNQERWEEASGYSPNTLAVMAAALYFSGHLEGAQAVLKTALSKTVSNKGPLSLFPYFVRIAQQGTPDAGGFLQIANGGPRVPENVVLDGGFIEWLRWFPQLEIFFGEDGKQLKHIVDNTLSLYDNPANGVAFSYPEHLWPELLRDVKATEANIHVTKYNDIPLYRRYTSDAYGVGGKGGFWPILTLERAFYDFTKRLFKRDIIQRYSSFIQKTWTPSGLCPEQVVLDKQLAPMSHAATPLMWCHAEFVELVSHW